MSKMLDYVYTHLRPLYKDSIVPAQRFLVHPYSDILNLENLDDDEIFRLTRNMPEIPFKNMVVEAPFQLFILERMEDYVSLFIVTILKGSGQYHLIDYEFRVPLGYMTVDNDIKTFKTREGVPGLEELPNESRQSILDTLALIFIILNRLTSYKTSYVEEPVRLNHKRAKRGKPPILSYHELILSDRISKKAKGSGSHSSPAMHKRRGHFRKNANGKISWIREMTVGNAKNGIALKTYVPN